MILTSLLAMTRLIDAPVHAEPLAQSPQDGAAYDVYLKVTLNGQGISPLVHFRWLHGQLAATGLTLSHLGLKIGVLGIAKNVEVPLDSIKGLHYHYDSSAQSVDLSVPDSARAPYIFDAHDSSKNLPASSARGLIINYDAYLQSDASAAFSLWTEQRYFDPQGVFSNTGVAYLYRTEHRYLRYDTSWSHSNPATLDTTQVGDFISSSLAWSRSIRMGGFQWRSNFALRPDLLTFPVPALSGSAVVPSSVDLYINNVHQFNGNVPSGPFVINEVSGLTGGGQATIVTHDALGRSVTTTLPLYIDDRLLTPGLASYSFEAGFLRRDYGLNSFDYDPHPATSGSVRYGVNRSLTAEGHAEASHGMLNLGAGLLLKMGQAGVVNGAWSASAGQLAGIQWSLGYQLIQPHYSINVQSTRAVSHYGDLGALEDTPVPAITDTVTLALPVTTYQSIAFSYIGSKFPQTGASDIGSLSYALNLGGRIALNLSAYQDFKQRNSRGVFLSFSMELGKALSINATVGKQNDQLENNVSANRTPDYAGGWGWGVQTSRTDQLRYSQAQAQYLGHAGQVTALVQNDAGSNAASLDMTGALVSMDHSIEVSRTITDGFALISTDGIGDIPVLHENRVIGVTDQGGHLLVPDLNAYQSNQLSIDSTRLPADARIDNTTLDLAPQDRSGVLAHFAIARYRAATLILHGPDGNILPVGTPLHHQESGQDTIVGYDGLAFIDSLQRDNHLQVDSGALHCTAHFAYTPPNNGSLPTIGPVTCHTRAENSP